MQRVCAQLRRWGVQPVAGEGEERLAAADAADCGRFLGQCLAAWESGHDLVLLGADWTPRGQVEAYRVAATFVETESAARLRLAHGPLILISTGGSSGKRRFAVHTGGTLLAAAAAFVTRFGLGSANTWNVLPLHHVGGMMSVLRSALADAAWGTGHYRELQAVESTPLIHGSLSLVPTQLQRLLADRRSVSILRRFGYIFIGGAALDPALADRARQLDLPLAPCYGMTETAAMVTALDPERFLAGEDGCGVPLPHVSIGFSRTSTNAPERIEIQAPSVAFGYAPDGLFERHPFVTADLGYLAPGGSLQVCGRTDRILISGGENVDPERVASVLCRILGTSEVHVFGVPDADWGQRVVACVAGVPTSQLEARRWESELAKAERPKAIIPVESIPRTSMGKPDTLAMIAAWEQQSRLPG